MEVIRVTPEQSTKIAALTGELLEEIMKGIQERVFNFEQNAAAKRLSDFIAEGKYFVFAAVAEHGMVDPLGFVSMHESYSLYAGGAFGTIPELYVKPAYRSQGIGKALLDTARRSAMERGWTRLELTTPPLPQFQRTLEFYEREGCSVSGGRKLKLVL